MKRKSLFGKEYLGFLNEIKGRIASARIQASRAVNRELIQLYWDVGRMIVERQKKYSWGEGVVERLSKDIAGEFDQLEGFSTHNLWRMRVFYLVYRNKPKLAQLVLEIPWGHNVLILQKTKDDDKEREYYLRSCIQFGWSRNILLNQIKNHAYQLQAKKPKQNNFSKVLPSHLTEQAEESIRSVYNLDFLGIARPVLERELERRLVQRVKRFILELGSSFSFIGNQYRLELDGDEYFVDLLFFNRKLRCLVAVELKTGKFEPEYAGKIDFYLHLLNDQVRLEGENPAIGIILCAEKKHVVVEYALRSVKNPVGVAEYRLTKKLPTAFKGILSDIELKRQICEEIQK